MYQRARRRRYSRPSPDDRTTAAPHGRKVFAAAEVSPR
jgi:hypothetical protein